MKKQLLIAFTALFTVTFLFSACTNSTEKAQFQEPTTQVEAPATTPPADTTANAAAETGKAEKGEKGEKDDDDDDDKKK